VAWNDLGSIAAVLVSLASLLYARRDKGDADVRRTLSAAFSKVDELRRDLHALELRVASEYSRREELVSLQSSVTEFLGKLDDRMDQLGRLLGRGNGGQGPQRGAS